MFYFEKCHCYNKCVYFKRMISENLNLHNKQLYTNDCSISFLLLALWSIIDACCWVWPWCARALGEVADYIIGCLCVGCVEEITSHQLQVVFLNQSILAYHPLAQDSGVTGCLSHIRHVHLKRKVFMFKMDKQFNLLVHSSA
jgi:hypothetical protein